MRRPHRLLIAAALLAGGTGVALVSRRHADTAAPHALSHTLKSPTSLGPLPLDLSEKPTQPAHLSGKIEADTSSGPDSKNSSIIIPSNSAAPGAETSSVSVEDNWRPSVRAASYQPADSRPAPPRQEPPQSKVEPKKTVTFELHRIVDGDTLSGLALRYLGSSKRFSEIFEANRDRLQSPDLLPIGTELRIPVKHAERGE